MCVLCSTGCGLDIGVARGQIVGVRGRVGDRVNHGRLGPKGLHGWEANASPDRLTQPLIRRDGELVAASWDEAMRVIVERSKGLLDEFGPGSHSFYNSGQLLLEEYYTLALVAEAGIGTSHVDGNTRLCTSTASIALIESFGTDGAPGSYTDFDLTEAIFMVGHNMASTQTVLWARVLDRLDGPRPPRLVVVDPRRTMAARRADVHLAPKPGTNLPLLSGLLRIIIERGWIDADFIRDHTQDFEALVSQSDPWTTSATSSVTGVPEASIEAAAEILGTAGSLVSTCLQGVYQSLQATASAVQVNNLHLIRGLIGKPGSTVFQMNGQPTAQNTRECGVNGEFVAFRNWQNPDHVADQARIWNVEPEKLPTWTPPTPAMQMFQFMESGSIRLLWVIGTNPAVSLPEVTRIRRILASDTLFLIVSDAFLTETAALADVVLPAALWGEKTGCTTNADRTVHLSEKAVEPPGEARSDLDALLHYARLMDFRDRDGAALIKWHDAEGAFDAWRECSRGRPCDYSAMSYAKLRERGAIQWPCTDEFPDGKERQYEDAVFNTSAEYCETYGHDLVTGAAVTPTEYAARDPKGRAMIKVAEYLPPPEEPDDEYPLLMMTGRVPYHFHTRTKTGRSPALDAAAPAAFIELSPADADRAGVAEGDLVEVRSRRGQIVVPARVSGVEPGVAFVPFHYGDDGDGPPTAANRLTLSGLGPGQQAAALQVRRGCGSKGRARLQPERPRRDDAARRLGDRTLRVDRCRRPGRRRDGAAVTTRQADVPAESPQHTERRPVRARAGPTPEPPSGTTPPAPPGARPQVAYYLGVARANEEQLLNALVLVAERHERNYEISRGATTLAGWSRQHLDWMELVIERFRAIPSEHAEALRSVLLSGTRAGVTGELADLCDLAVLAERAEMTWTVIYQGARELHDGQLQDVASRSRDHSKRQIAWIRTQIDHLAPDALAIPLDPGAQAAISMPKRLNAVSSLPDWIWAPVATAAMLAIVGALGLAIGRPWLGPSLGPTVVLVAMNSAHPTSRAWNVLVGHVGGLIAGFVAVALAGAVNAPSVLETGELTAPRVIAGIVSVPLTVLVGILLRASHPPAAATTLLVALGAVATLDEALAVASGVAVITVAGELFRRMRLERLTPSERRAPVDSVAGLRIHGD